MVTNLFIIKPVKMYKTSECFEAVKKGLRLGFLVVRTVRMLHANTSINARIKEKVRVPLK